MTSKTVAHRSVQGTPPGPDELMEAGATLLQEHVWRQREAL
jgi:hypothetical protein